MPQIQDVTRYLETSAPPAYQESYDNSGLIVGNPQVEVSGILISLDATEAVVDEAIAKGCNLIVSHHSHRVSRTQKSNGKKLRRAHGDQGNQE